jgi:hypothetical protein
MQSIQHMDVSTVQHRTLQYFRILDNTVEQSGTCCVLIGSHWKELNPRPSAYKADMLPQLTRLSV